MPFFLFLLSLSLTEVRVNVYDTTAKMVSLYPEVDGEKKIESLLFKLTNIERQKKGLKKLSFDRRLRIAARQHTNDMLNGKYLSHISVDKVSKTPLCRIYNSGLPILKVGENLAEDVGDLIPVFSENNIDSLAKRIVDGWMHSPGHRKNIMEPDFTHMGIGSIIRGETHKVTQNFADKSDFSVDSVMAEIDSNKYLVHLYMDSFVSGLNIFDNGELINPDSVYIRSGNISFSLKRSSGLHEIELCLKEYKLYRCGVDLLVDTDSSVENIFPVRNCE